MYVVEKLQIRKVVMFRYDTFNGSVQTLYIYIFILLYIFSATAIHVLRRRYTSQ